jgi:ETS-domain lacking
MFFSLPLSLLLYFQMQVENSNSLHDRARLFSRIPPCIDLSAVTNCASETEKRWKSNGGNQNGNNFNKPLHVKTSNIDNAIVMKIGADGLPIGESQAILTILSRLTRFFLDPRDWTRQDVKIWILNLGKSEGVDASHIAEKFNFNGKALCLMSVEMFLSRFPTGGKMLYRDFRLRLTRAMSL